MDRHKSRIYTDRPAYADFDAPAKFEAIKSIIAKRLLQYPNAICSYSGGSDSDIMLDLIERTRQTFKLPPVQYVFFNTGLEMKATKDHVKAVALKYGVSIEEARPEISIVKAAREYGIPFISKQISQSLGDWQEKGIPISIVDEFEQAYDKAQKRTELKERYPNSVIAINFLCNCDSAGNQMTRTQTAISSEKYLLDFLRECPPDFRISSKCCYYCKKKLARKVEKDYDMVITGERFAEGGTRAISRKDNTSLCFSQQANGKYRLKPLFYVSNMDKEWYKDYYGIRYSDGYEVYGLTRTGCCGCPINYKAVDDLEKVRQYEPNVVNAAWNVFGKSYEYRAKYNEYRERRKKEAREHGQITLNDVQEEQS